MSGRNFVVAPLALLLALGGCGQELTAGGQRGEVDAVVTDSDAAPPASRSASGGGPAFSFSRVVTVPTGTVTVEGSVELLDAAGDGTPLAGGDGEASVTIGAPGSDVLATDSVPAVRYPRVRITFTRVEASVTGGLLSGSVGVPVTVQVDLPQPRAVERSVELMVRDEGEHRLAIDLNAATWLAAVDPVTGLVSATDFAAAVAVRVE